MAGRGEQAQALGWFCRLLIEQAMSRGERQHEIADTSGVRRSALNRILLDGTGVGIDTAERLAVKFKYESAGDLWNAAVKWWPVAGKAYAKAALEDLAKRRVKDAG